MHTEHPGLNGATWTLFALLLGCALISLIRAAAPGGGDRDGDIAHLAMNLVMAAMLLDHRMVGVQWWSAATVLIAAGCVARLVRRPDPSHAASTFWAVCMVAATVVAVTDTAVTDTAGGLRTALTLIVVVDLVVTTALLAVGDRVPVAVTIGGGAAPTRADRLGLIPHVGMSIGMLAMLAGG
ncbi:DUF5134 domain-containing protein [Skermania piniformis]|uniref:DUF5134 domain-containing protein n=2 Tax=Skermania pinensis TaxID=39122 RepID=A0ABX8S742_9ACTN|nr:DUF5134 domain-containing protein [Skermania piniformis]QXQ12330.1 DUF5134 domain-containing protein [Skermania piniformis]